MWSFPGANPTTSAVSWTLDSSFFSAQSVQIGDVNNDGLNDLVACSECPRRDWDCFPCCHYLALPLGWGAGVATTPALHLCRLGRPQGVTTVSAPCRVAFPFVHFPPGPCPLPLPLPISRSQRMEVATPRCFGSPTHEPLRGRPLAHDRPSRVTGLTAATWPWGT